MTFKPGERVNCTVTLKGVVIEAANDGVMVEITEVPQGRTFVVLVPTENLHNPDQRPTLVQPSDLMALIDIADMLGVKPNVVGNWKARHSDFPEPIGIVGRDNTALYRRRDVLAYTHKRRLTK